MGHKHPASLFPHIFRELLREAYRTVTSARAAKCDDELALSLPAVVRKQIRDHFRNAAEIFFALLKAHHIIPDTLLEASVRLQLLHIVWDSADTVRQIRGRHPKEAPLW